MTVNSPQRAVWRHAVRLAWLVFFGLAVLAFVVAVPARWTELVHPETTTQAHLTALGWPIGLYAGLTFVTEVLFTASFMLVGLFIFIRRSDDGMALYTALMLVAFAVGNRNMTLTLSALRTETWGPMLIAGFAFLAWGTLTQFPFLFPSGRYTPAWMLLPGLACWGIVFGWNILPGSVFDQTTWPLALDAVVSLGLFVTMAVSVIYRFRRVAPPIQQQIKWIVWGVILILVWEITSLIIQAAFDNRTLAYVGGQAVEPPTPQIFAVNWVSQGIYRLVYPLVPVTLSISILRYRLWDIDLLIRRTLVYSALTGLLAGVYFSSILVFENGLRGLTGGESPLVIVLSTLLIAALFVPLRARVQQAIDRRFYRKKYDAARTLAAFAAHARDETDLARLSGRLTDVVGETMQPASVSLWLKQ